MKTDRSYDRFAKAVQTLGEPGFFAALDAALSGLVRNDYPQFWLFRKGEAPRSLYHTLRGRMRHLHVEGYIAGAYRDDPVYRESLREKAPKLVRITEITATRFRQSEYYRRFHGPTGNIDEATFIIHTEGGAVINLPIMRVQGSGRFSEAELASLRAVEPLVRELVLKHWRMTAAEPQVGTDTGQATDHFGTAFLTAREQETVRLLLTGHSAKTAAERLGISPETLRRHRKSIYEKLDIGSIAELFTLFINALPYFDPAAPADPLSAYMSNPDHPD